MIRPYFQTHQKNKNLKVVRENENFKNVFISKKKIKKSELIKSELIKSKTSRERFD